MEKLMKDRLNELIEKKGLTATKFATLIDANPSAISHLLKGRNKPGYDLLVNITKAFPDISMDWLLTGHGNMIQSAAASVQLQEPSEPEKKMSSRENSATAAIPSEIAAVIPPSSSKKILKRIILFFEDGSFEDYTKGE